MCKCNKNTSTLPVSSSSSDAPETKSTMRNSMKQNKDSSPKKPRRRSRTKTRKPKFLSLRLQLSQSQNQNQHKPQLNLFPMHPENLVEDKDMHEDQNDVALLFSSDTGDTLNGLLQVDSTTTTTTNTGTTTTSEEDSFSPPSLRCRIDAGDDNGSWLVRKAMRRRDDTASEGERWVCYSEVVEKKELMEEVTSYSSTTAVSAAVSGGAAECDFGRRRTTTSFGLLSLKLDYQGILNAWSDRSPLYVAGEAPQTVPEFMDDIFPNNVGWDGWGSSSDAGNTWKVPEDCGANKMLKVKEEITGKVGNREASVLRYKEKRQSRLFAKRIRYEVRKLNAEKRPRMKGRFVKRD